MGLYDDSYNWAFAVGKRITEQNEDLLRRLIFAVRGEETPGRFLDKLSETIAEYRTNRSINLDVSLHPSIFAQDWFADRFYYLKASILSGFLNALATTRGRE